MKPIFRTSMFGFNKEDVFNFMTKQNKQYESKVADLTAQIENQSAEFERERENLISEMSELENLRASAEGTRALLNDIKLLSEQLLSDQTKIASCISVIGEEKSSDRVKIAEMEKRVCEAEKLRAKAEKFDQLSGVLSSIFNQPEMASSAEEALSEPMPAAVEDSKTLEELTELVSALSSRCEKLQEMLSGNENV